MRRFLPVIMGLAGLSILFVLGFSGAKIRPDTNDLAATQVAASYFPSGPILGTDTRLQDWELQPFTGAISETATSFPEDAGCRPISPLSPSCVGSPGTAVGALVGTERWRPLVEQHFRPEDVERALDVIACESGGNPNAANPVSSARGLFQHLASYWPERAARAGIPDADISDPEDNVAVAAWLVYHGGGWDHWRASQSCW